MSLKACTFFRSLSMSIYHEIFLRLLVRILIQRSVKLCQASIAPITTHTPKTKAQIWLQQDGTSSHFFDRSELC